MLKISEKHIDLDDSELLYSHPFNTDSLSRYWRIRGGSWWVEDGWLTGRNPDNAPGMIVSTDDYLGNVILDFEARTVLPSSHDIDCMWNGSWDERTNQRGLAYVAGIQGWWEGKVGVEKSPQCALKGFTPLFPFEPGRIYRIQAGSVDGHCFVFIDGRLVFELFDPDPVDANRHGKVGFEAYSSFIQVRELKIRRITWQPVALSYGQEL